VAKTVKIVFDCGEAGKVVWEAPRDIFKSGLSDREVRNLSSQAWGESVELFFGVLMAAGLIGLDATSTVITEIDSSLHDIARRAVRRAQG